MVLGQFVSNEFIAAIVDLLNKLISYKSVKNRFQSPNIIYFNQKK